MKLKENYVCSKCFHFKNLIRSDNLHLVDISPQPVTISSIFDGSSRASICKHAGLTLAENGIGFFNRSNAISCRLVNEEWLG